MRDTFDAYRSHKWTAKSRGIPFLMTYEEWLSEWEKSGKLSERGKGSGKYVMARAGDTGPYAVGNVYICTFNQNITDSVLNGCRKRKPSKTEQILSAVKASMGKGKQAVPRSKVEAAKTYREAVRLCWQIRRVQEMTQGMLADLAGLYASHVSDFLNSDDKPSRRSLPAESISEFEAVCGNTLISQWLASRARLTVLEELQASRAA